MTALEPQEIYERTRLEGELWVASLVPNLVEGALLVLLLTSNGVLRAGSFEPGTAFLRALVAGP